jgi:hypothetical protein
MELARLRRDLYTYSVVMYVSYELVAEDGKSL